MRIRRTGWMVAVAMLAAAALAACMPKAPAAATGCISPDALDATTKLIKDAVEQDTISKAKMDDGSSIAPDASIRAAVNLLKITIQDIRTTKVDPNSTKRFCTGTARVVFPLKAIQDADTARSLKHMNSVDNLAQAAGVQRSADIFTFPIDFDVQPTDDQKTTYAESDTIGAQKSFFSEVILSYLVKNAIVADDNAQQQAKQQAAQAALDEANAEDRLSIQTINAVWSQIDPDTRGQLLDVQRAWIKEKDANCTIQAAAASIDPVERQTAQVKCDASANAARIDWLKQYLPSTASQ
ncbi:MAG: lysozyme inhibitor LprI family protein [Caulobacterales bacterium]